MGEKNNISTLIEHFQNTPIVEITNIETEEYLVLFGSYVSIIKNKTLNQNSMVVELINDTTLQEQFCELFACDDFRVALALIFSNNINLVKSKAIKESIKKRKYLGLR